MSARRMLAAGDLRVEVAPAVGGSVARFDRGGQALLRPAPDGADDVLAMACFPLVPYCNRIRGGTFLCDGHEVRLAPNMAGDPSPLHGDGWLAMWRVAAADARRIELVYEHPTGEWPWRYEARQVLTLDAQGLSLTLTCRNLSSTPMPCGLGFHPYYPCDAGTVLDTAVEAVWTVDADVLPVAREPATGRYDLAERRICGQALDNGYDGWSGTAAIRWPGAPAGLRLTSPDARRFQVYAPASGSFFAAEPVQNANAALNETQDLWPELGITMLAEGETAVTAARFEVIL